MVEEKPRRNLLAIAALARVVMYVGSYLFIRAHSGRLPFHWPGSEAQMVFEVAEKDIQPFLSDGGKGPEIQRNSEFLRMIFHPLLTLDRKTTRKIF